MTSSTGRKPNAPTIVLLGRNNREMRVAFEARGSRVIEIRDEGTMTFPLKMPEIDFRSLESQVHQVTCDKKLWPVNSCYFCEYVRKHGGPVYKHSFSPVNRLPIKGSPQERDMNFLRRFVPEIV